jgi:D-beta-D-heptose 7-phosphate kinase/D-beta-D-heptose 1-phosphate adenosyltransferase
MNSKKSHRGKIVGLGDFLVDVWWRVTTANRNVEHAAMALCSLPGDCQIRPGGAGLLMDAVGRFGFSGCLFTTVDNSLTTAAALARLEKHIDVSRVHMTNLFCTPVKTRYVNTNGHILMRHDAEPTKPFVPGQLLISDFIAELQAAKCVVVSDYAKGCLAGNIRRKIVANSKAYCVPVFVDAKPQTLPDYVGADLVKINMAELDEFAAKFGFTKDALPESSSIAETLQQKLEFVAKELRTPFLLVTAGSYGVWHVLHQRNATFVKAPKSYSSGNCVGAGDVFLAGIILGFSELGDFNTRTLAPADISLVLSFGFSAAGQRVRTNSTKAVNERQVLKEVAGSDLGDGRLLSPRDFIRFAQIRRAAGFRVVFTNGCFDLLHAGHRSLLRQAKEEGDVLIVAVDSDANVRRNKGNDRPIQDQDTRAGNIAALSGVSAVCVFDAGPDGGHNTLLQLIRDVQPDVLVKGKEYAGRVVVGADDVMKQEVPGRVVLVPMVAGASTTALVTKMKA